MPKTEIDYSNTIIYKITCKNQTIKDVYVGHTTNFVQRKHAHKQSCINSKSANYKCKLYEVIRANGGWENWQMEIINFFNCADHYAARKKEQEYFIELKANLNSIEPFPKQKNKHDIETENKIENIEPKLYCNTCNIKCNNLKSFENHNNSNKHKKGGIIKSKVKISEKSTTFTCEICHYVTSNKKDYKKHEDTIKHKALSNPNDPSFKKPLPVYQCKCGKIYKHAPTLSAHKKKCNFKASEPKLQPGQYIKDDPCKTDPCKTDPIKNIPTMDFLTNFVIETVKHNQDLQKQMIEMQKQILEVCKGGIMYVKDQNIWEKENSSYDKLRKAIKSVTYKNSSLLEPWSKAHPQCMNTSHRLNDVYVKMIGQSMGGKESFLESENKIMKRIAKAVLIDKA